MEITPPKQSDGRTDGASRVHYITCVNCATGAGRANDRAVGRNYCPGLGAGEIAVQEVAVTKSKQCSDRHHAQSCSVPFFLLPLGRPLASVFPHHQSRSPFLRLAQVYQVQDSPSTKTKIQVTSFLANFSGSTFEKNLRANGRRGENRSVVAPTDERRRRRRFRVARGRQIVHLPTALQWPHTDDAKEGSEREAAFLLSQFGQLRLRMGTRPDLSQVAAQDGPHT